MAIEGVADELYESRKNNDETLFRLKNIAGSLDLISQYLYDISWELKKNNEKKVDSTPKIWENYNHDSIRHTRTDCRIQTTYLA